MLQIFLLVPAGNQCCAVPKPDEIRHDDVDLQRGYDVKFVHDSIWFKSDFQGYRHSYTSTARYGCCCGTPSTSRCNGAAGSTYCWACRSLRFGAGGSTYCWACPSLKFSDIYVVPACTLTIHVDIFRLRRGTPPNVDTLHFLLIISLVTQVLLNHFHDICVRII